MYGNDFRIWFEKILYTDERLQINNNLDTDTNSIQRVRPQVNDTESVQERPIQVYKFKAPAFLRKLTNTYFKQSHIKDLRDLR